MSARALVLVLSLALSWPRSALATTSSCANVGDGTPCTGVCVEIGTCVDHVCTAGTLRPNGTPCSSEDVCTTGDACVMGACVPGVPRVCPDRSACDVGICRLHIGCTFKSVCPPDLAGVDLASAPDLLPPPDLYGLDLTGVDLCVVPPGSEFFTCDNPDGQYTVDEDASTDGGLDAGVPYHVRGSRIGDCALGGGSARDSLGIALLLLALVTLVLRTGRRDA